MEKRCKKQKEKKEQMMPVHANNISLSFLLSSHPFLVSLSFSSLSLFLSIPFLSLLTEQGTTFLLV